MSDASVWLQALPKTSDCQIHPIVNRDERRLSVAADASQTSDCQIHPIVNRDQQRYAATALMCAMIRVLVEASGGPKTCHGVHRSIRALRDAPLTESPQ